ncbi:hypothetical protein [Lysinibacillus fusiformis]|uniref:hypothetical protein n=1 Tax=Lysinibacillus fusiformis TaxID=28031 RepID=UPI00046B0A66|nr:hypothetical protein [Lysinibacillus fusiformis]
MNVFDMASETLQKAIKAVVDATKVKVDGIDSKQDQLASSIDGMNTKIVKMDSPFEAGKFVPFQITSNLGMTNGTVVYSVTGSGLLDLALAVASTNPYNASIRVTVDSVVMVQAPPTQAAAIGVLPTGDWSGTGSPLVHITRNGASSALIAQGTYTPGLTTSSMGVLWINRPIKFNKSLEISVGMSNDGYYRIQGGLFI